MGSDMAMERIVDTRKGVWEMDGDEQVFRVYNISGYDGQQRILWEGRGDALNDENIYRLVSLLIPTVPSRPEPVKTLRTRVYDVLHGYFWGTVADYGWVENDLYDIADELIMEVEKDA